METSGHLWHKLDVPFLDATEAALVPLDHPPVLLSYLYGADRIKFARPHDFYESWTLIAPEKGAIRVRLGAGQWHELRLGWWVVCPPHTAIEREAVQIPFAFHFVRFDWHQGADAALSVSGPKTTRHLHRLTQNLEDWRALQGFTSTGAQRWREHLLWDTLGLGWQEQHDGRKNDLADSAMLRARALIQTHADEGISLADVAAQLQLSPVALTRQFRAAFGVTPSQFLLRQRLDRARQLLISTDWPLDTIAAQCGLGNGFYLSRVWSKQFGQSPSRFRRANQI